MNSRDTSNILQVNSYSFDERYYQHTIEQEDGNTVVKFYPSVTFIISCCWNKGEAFTKWIGQVGTLNATTIMEEAGAVGSCIHEAVENLIDGETVVSDDIDGSFKPYLSQKVKYGIKSFLKFCEDYEPRFESTEFITYCEEFGYAGTVDILCWIRADKFMTKTAVNTYEKEEIKKISEEFDIDPRTCYIEVDYKWVKCIIDVKSSKDVHEEHKMQLASYLYSETDGTLTDCRAAILHIGNSTKIGYSFLPLKESGEDGNSVDDWFRRFKVCCVQVFKERFPNAKPKTDVFPKEFKLTKENN